jgi:uncharacterized protein (TIGR03435 family)
MGVHGGGKEGNSVTPRSILLNGAAAILVAAPSAFAQQRQGAALPSSYDVVSIKLESQDPPSVGIRYTATGFEAYAVTLTDLIKEAYGLPDVRLVKGAANIKPKYHVVAKLSDSDANTLRSLSAKELAEERQRLLQAMLADRFALAVHHTKSPLPIYSLEVAKRGLKLQEVTPGSGGAAQLKADSFISDGRIMGVFSMERLAHNLSLMHKLNWGGSDRTVVDDTGLSGNYIVDLAWTGPSVSRPPMVSATTEVYGSVNSALAQVGLRLAAKTVDADSVVVDHANVASLD